MFEARFCGYPWNVTLHIDCITNVGVVQCGNGFLHCVLLLMGFKNVYFYRQSILYTNLSYTQYPVKKSSDGGMELSSSR